MKQTVRGASRALMAAILIAAASALAAAAQPGCEVCGAALGPEAVVVTDWETNREYRYHDLSCAVGQMATRFPWSRAATSSPASGERITLTRINGSWRAQPEGAIAVEVTQAVTLACRNVIAFASRDEFRAYQEKHRSKIPQGSEPAPLASLAAQYTVAAPVQPPAAAAAEVPQVPAAAPAAAAFRDVPADHWAAEFVKRASELGLMKGFPDGTFRGDQPVTRYELAAVLARLSQEGAAAPAREAEAGPAASPEPPPPSGPPEPSPGVSEAQPTPEPAVATPSRASLLGLSGLLSVPDARVRAAGTGAAVAGIVNGKFVGAVSAGIGDEIEVAATSAQLHGDGKLFLSAKQRLASLSRPGLDVAAGITGLGTDSSVFAVATRDVRLGATQAEATLGIGTGGLLRGPFAGVSAPLGRVAPFAEAVNLIAESANLGDGRHLNYGLDLALRRGLDLKVGQVDDRFAAGVLLERGF